MPGTQCPSLGAINIVRAKIRLFEDGYGALKADIGDNETDYCVKVTSRRLRDARDTGGVNAATGTLPVRGVLHVRLGLAHAYARPNDTLKCYMMLNGIL